MRTPTPHTITPTDPPSVELREPISSHADARCGLHLEDAGMNPQRAIGDGADANSARTRGGGYDHRRQS